MTLQQKIKQSKRTGKLGLSFMDVTTLPPLPPWLTHLTCYSTQLTTLPPLPPGLRFLYCTDNQLTTLPTLPPGLRYLYCARNQLATLPTLPSTLKELYCANNPFTQVFAEQMGTDPTETIQRIQMYYANIKEQSRNILALQQTLGKGYNCILNDDCLNIVGSYISGQSGTIPMQITRLRTILI